MYRARVIYVGQSPAVLEWLCQHPRVELIKAYCPPSALSCSELLTCSLHYGVPLSWARDSAELEASLPVGLDLAVCAFFERISPRLLGRARLGWLNLHPAPLPERPGRYPTIEGVLEGDPRWGATLHWMTPTLDQGPIIDVAYAPRGWEDGPAELEARAISLGLALLDRHLDAILDGYSTCEDQPPLPAHRADRRLPTLSLEQGPLSAWRAVRACAPFGGLPMRYGQRLVWIKEARLTPSLSEAPDEPHAEGWSTLAHWTGAQPCRLEARLEAVEVGVAPVSQLTLERVARVARTPWRLPSEASLEPLSEQERALFTFEDGLVR